jgi:hypothetical protein
MAAPSISTASASGSAACSARASAVVATKRSPLRTRPAVHVRHARAARGAQRQQRRSRCVSADIGSVEAAACRTAAPRSAGNIGDASMSCCKKLSATTTSPTFTPSPRPPATPVNTMRARQSARSARGRGGRRHLADARQHGTTSCPCSGRARIRARGQRLRSSGIRASTAASSSCMALTMAMVMLLCHAGLDAVTRARGHPCVRGRGPGSSPPTAAGQDDSFPTSCRAARAAGSCRRASWATRCGTRSPWAACSR